MSEIQTLDRKQFVVGSKLVSELALLFTAYIVFTGLLFLHFRVWEPDITRQVLGIFSYPAIFFGGIALAWLYIDNVIWILPIGCLIFMGLPFLSVLLGKEILFSLGIVGVGATLFAYLSNKPKCLKRTILLIGGGFTLATLYFLVVNGYGYAHLFSDIAAYNSNLHRDTLFHSAIVQMIAQFDTPSTGLDGVKKLSYHVGVHRWVAANLRILGGEATLLLGICQQIAFLPVLFFTTILTISLLATLELTCLVACAFGFLSLWLTATRSWDSYLASESYALSLPILVSMLPVGKSWLLGSLKNRRWLTIHPLGITNAVIALWACQSAKVSSGVMLALFLILCMIVPKICQNKRVSWIGFARFSGVGIGFACLALILAFNFSDTLPLSFYPLHFARAYPKQFIWKNILFLGLIIPFYFLSSKNGKLHQISQSLVLTVMFLASQLPGALLEIGGGSAFYFVDPALLCTLFFTLAATIDYWQTHRKMGLIAFVNPTNHSWQPVSKKLGWFTAFLILIVLFNSGMSETSYLGRSLNFVRGLATTLDSFSAGELFELRGLEKRKHQFGLLFYPPKYPETFGQNTGLGYVQAHIRHSGISPGDRKSVIHISPGFTDFWKPEASRNCWDISFVVPATTGIPLLNGVRNKNNGCDTTMYYGMANYNSESWNRPISNLDLCKKAINLGFVQVLSITDKSTYSLLNCKQVTKSS